MHGLTIEPPDGPHPWQSTLVASRAATVTDPTGPPDDHTPGQRIRRLLITATMASLVSYALVAFIWHGAHAAPRPHLANGTSQPSSRAVPSAPARLGIATQSGPTGVTVMTVTAGSAAARTGIRTGDVLTAVDDVPVDSPAHLTSIVRSHRAGDTIRVVLVRNGRRITVVATLDSA